MLEGFLIDAILNVPAAKAEETADALVHKVMQVRMLVGCFQKVVYGLQDVHVSTIACQHSILGYGYAASALFVEVLSVPIGLGLEKAVPIVVHDEFQ